MFLEIFRFLMFAACSEKKSVAREFLSCAVDGNDYSKRVMLTND